MLGRPRLRLARRKRVAPRAILACSLSERRWAPPLPTGVGTIIRLTFITARIPIPFIVRIPSPTASVPCTTHTTERTASRAELTDRMAAWQAQLGTTHRRGPAREPLAVAACTAAAEQPGLTTPTPALTAQRTRGRMPTANGAVRS